MTPRNDKLLLHTFNFQKQTTLHRAEQEVKRTKPGCQKPGSWVPVLRLYNKCHKHWSLTQQEMAHGSDEKRGKKNPKKKSPSEVLENKNPNLRRQQGGPPSWGSGEAPSPPLLPPGGSRGLWPHHSSLYFCCLYHGLLFPIL
jgi:hypothetical protein